MTTYNTGNPLGSVDVKDLYDNSQNLDDAVNSLEPTWVDRFGRTRTTLQGGVNDAVTLTQLSGTGTGNGAALVGFKQAGTGAVDRTALDKMREVVSVKDFGATGAAGENLHGPLSAIAANTTATKIHIDNPSFTVSPTISFNRDVTFVGTGHAVMTGFATRTKLEGITRKTAKT